jgi:hypothetical protein
VVSQRFTHPFTLSLEDWTSILAELHVQRQAEGLLDPVPEGPVMAAFTEEEVRYLSVTLSKAFAQAQPHEWVVFGLSRATPRGLTELTTGGGYVAGPSLHVALVNYRKIVTMPRTRQLLWKRPLRPDDAAPAADRQRIDGLAQDHRTAARFEREIRINLRSVCPREAGLGRLLGSRRCDACHKSNSSEHS